jgi:hypothetical protein
MYTERKQFRLLLLMKYFVFKSLFIISSRTIKLFSSVNNGVFLMILTMLVRMEALLLWKKFYNIGHRTASLQFPSLCNFRQGWKTLNGPTSLFKHRKRIIENENMVLNHYIGYSQKNDCLQQCIQFILF